MPLRGYQQELVNEIRKAFMQGAKGVMGQLPTGAGKTYTALHIAGLCALRARHTTLIVVHRDELLFQWEKEARNLGIDCGLTAASVGKKTKNPDALVQIAMIDTINRRPSAFKGTSFDWIYFDEAHLGSARKYDRLRSRYPDAKYIGWTATPSRLDNKGFPWCETLIRGPSYSKLEEEGSLVPFTIYSIDKLDYTGLRKRFGEYTAKSQTTQYMTQPLIGSVVTEYVRTALGRTGLVFAVTVEHSKKLAAEFQTAGIPAAHIDGNTPKDQRHAILTQLAEGKIWIVCNVGVLIEGLNVTSISYIGCAFATASLAKWIQCAGRALRPHHGKTDAIICDHGGNALRHGSLDYDFPWQITPRVKRKRSTETEIKARICQVCNAIYPMQQSICPVCGAVHVPEKRQPKQKEGKLSKIQRKSGPSRRKPKTTVRELEEDVLSWVSSFR